MSEYFLEFISLAPKIETESPVEVKVENLQDNVECDETQEVTPTVKGSNKTRKHKTPKASLSKKGPSTKPRIHCEVEGCNTSFFLQENYEGHLREHQGLKAGYCKICKKTFSTCRLMRRH